MWKLSLDTYKPLTSLVILYQSALKYLEMMSDSDVHLPSVSSSESRDTSYSRSREEIYKKLQVRFSSTKEISTKSD